MTDPEDGKLDGFVRQDFFAVAKRFDIAPVSAVENILEEIDHALGTWLALAAEADVPEKTASRISANHRRLETIA